MTNRCVLRRHITCNLDVHVSVQQQVLGLEIPVDDVAVVAVLDRRQDLPELPSSLDLTQPPVLRQVVCGKTVKKAVGHFMWRNRNPRWDVHLMISVIS